MFPCWNESMMRWRWHKNTCGW